jgi:beta-1,4-mannooligosaccharide/beta-1,4-mannosyl-N-acetylglucosamine phosphorylase
MAGRPHYWDEHIGSGPPPVRTRDGWLHVYHGVATHLVGRDIYQAGVCLLDLDDPTRVVARGRNNVLEPREPYELVGQVPNVVFPSGMIVDDFDEAGFARPESLVRVYYGAADTVVAMATTTIEDLLAACHVEGPAGP